jgi:hypothetical protein
MDQKSTVELPKRLTDKPTLDQLSDHVKYLQERLEFIISHQNKRLDSLEYADADMRNAVAYTDKSSQITNLLLSTINISYLAANKFGHVALIIRGAATITQAQIGTAMQICKIPTSLSPRNIVTLDVMMRGGTWTYNKPGAGYIGMDGIIVLTPETSGTIFIFISGDYVL